MIDVDEIYRRPKILGKVRSVSEFHPFYLLNKLTLSLSTGVKIHINKVNFGIYLISIKG